MRLQDRLPVLWVGILIFYGCADSDFAGTSRKRADKPTITEGHSEDLADDPQKPENDQERETDSDLDDGSDRPIEVDDNQTEAESTSDTDIVGDQEIDIGGGGTTMVKSCSRDYSVPGSANLYLAGMPDGTEIRYSSSTDRAPGQSPVLVDPDIGDCIKPGSKLYFEVTGMISHGSSDPTNADGRLSHIEGHQKHALFGKSHVIAPLNSLLGVFIGEGNPEYESPPPDGAFNSSDSRNYDVLKPMVGQIFFIGDGKNSAGKYQKVVVPEGASRLYLGIHDAYEWNNNSGHLTGAILWDPK